jgi:hypothetical protein
MSSPLFLLTRHQGAVKSNRRGAGMFHEKVKKFFNERKLTIKYLIVFYIIPDYRESSQLALRRGLLARGERLSRTAFLQIFSIAL